MRRTIVCPDCKARFDHGAEFEFVELVVSSLSSTVVGIDMDGDLEITGGEEHIERALAHRELVCMSCGYQWRTARSFGGRGSSS